jgi:hypothetical protein
LMAWQPPAEIKILYSIINNQSFTNTCPLVAKSR